MKHKVCFFNRSSIHYRRNVYNLMDKELGVDFYFGDSRPGKIKPMDVNELINFKGYFHNVSLGPIYWQVGSLSLLRSEYTDIITTADHYCLSTWVMLGIKRFFNKKIYLWTHGAYGSETGIKKWLTIWKMNAVDGIFVYGHHAKNILTTWGVNEDKINVIYNSLAYDEQISLRNSLKTSPLYKEHFNNEFPNLVFIGRLTAVKKLHLIVEALSLLKKRNFFFNLTFIGDGIKKTELKNLVEKLGLSNNVWFYGPCYDETLIADFLYNADMCVSPGDVGLTAMHAMAFGCPVISHGNFSHQMPEVEAIVEGETGSFFDEDNLNSLVDSIVRWFSSNKDREYIRKKCFNVIDEKYNPHKQISLLNSIIFK